MVPMFSVRYLSELLAERHKLGPFVPVLPHSYRLLNQGEQLFVVNLLHLLLEKRGKGSSFCRLLSLVLGTLNEMQKQELENGNRKKK